MKKIVMLLLTLSSMTSYASDLQPSENQLANYLNAELKNLDSVGSISCQSLNNSLANEIKCSGKTTDAALVLGLTGKIFPLSQADYSFKRKAIPTSGYEFHIDSNKNDGTQKLTYKFKTLKKHDLAKKNSKLILTIKQVSDDIDPFTFLLNPTYEAELKIEEAGSVRLIDKMDCK